MSITVTLTEITLKDQTKRLALGSPYHPSLPPRCRALGGRWDGTQKVWLFDPRDARKIRDLCVEVFAIDPLADPEDGPELVTARVRCDGFANEHTIWLFGRELAHQPSRDGRPRLGDGVVVVAGGFKGGGSRANLRLNPTDDTVLEVRDVPRPLVEEEIRALAERATTLRAIREDRQAELVRLRAEVEAIPTPVAPGSTEMANLHGLQRQIIQCQLRIDAVDRELPLLEGSVVLVEDAPAPERVDPALGQIIALARTLSDQGKRTAALSILGLLDRKAQEAFVEELQRTLTETR